MTADPMESLTALDFAQTCECPKHPCTSPATHVVQRHALHRCESEGLTADGNHLELLCGGCVNGLWAVVSAELGLLRRKPGRFACETCGAPVAEVGDVVRSVEVL